MVFHKLVSSILNSIGINELEVSVDTTHVFKYKIHNAGIHPFGIPIALEIMQNGKTSDITTFSKIADQVSSYNLPISFFIGDGAYDNAEFYYIASTLGAEGIAKYNSRRSNFKDSPTNHTIVEYFDSLLIEYNKSKKRKKKLPSKKIVLSDPVMQGKMLRDFPITEWNSQKRVELYKHRTLTERINSILKLWLGIEEAKTHSESSKIFNIYASFICLLIIAFIAIQLDIPQAMLRISLGIY